MSRQILIAVLFFLCLVVLSGCSQQEDILPGMGRIEGMVTDAETGEPIENAIAVLRDPLRRAVTDEDGRFAFVEVDSGLQAIAVQKLGHSPVKDWAGFPDFEVRSGSATVLSITLRAWKMFQPGSSVDFDDGYLKGRVLALAEIQNLDFCMYTGGYNPSGRRSLDEATGLPRRPVRGCEFDDWWDGLMRGHNDRMWEHVCENGFPDVPPWWRFDSWSPVSWYCNKPFVDSAFVELNKGSPVITSSDSCYTILLDALWELNFPRYLFTCGNGDTAITQLPAVGFDTLRVIWGPDSLDIAFLVTDNLQLSLLDLKTGELRVFGRYRNCRAVNAPVPKVRRPPPDSTSP